MTALATATLALLVASAIAAVALSRRAPGHQAGVVAAYLCAVVAIDAGRWARAWLLPLDGSWPGVARWTEVGLYVGAILALPAMAWGLFSRCHHRVNTRNFTGGGWTKPRGIAAAWILLTALIAGDPGLRGPALLRIYDWLELGAVVAALWCVGLWFRALIRGDAVAGPAHLAGLALISGPASIACLPWLTTDTVIDGWPFVVAGNALAVASCLVLLLWGLLRAGGEPCTS